MPPANDQGSIALPASVFRPILLFFAAFGDDMIIQMDSARLRMQAFSADHTHFLDLVVEREAALHFRAPPDTDEEHYDRPLRFSTTMLPVALRDTRVDTITLRLPAAGSTGFTLLLQHGGGQTDTLQFIEKCLDEDPFSPPENTEDRMSASFNSRELCDDINTFLGLRFDAVSVDVVDGEAVFLRAHDATNEVTERETTYTAAQTYADFAGGKVPAPVGGEEEGERAWDDSDGDEGGKRKDAGKKKPAAKRVAAATIVARQHRSVWGVQVSKEYERLSVSTKLMHKLCACTNMCDVVTLQSREIGGVGQLMCLDYKLKRDKRCPDGEMVMVAYLAPKVND